MKLSAVICTYNPNVDELSRKVSVAAKLFDEVIIIDDCSDILIPKFRNARVKYYRNLFHLGQEASKMQGVIKATGEAIAFIKDNKPLNAADVAVVRRTLDEIA